MSQTTTCYLLLTFMGLLPCGVAGREPVAATGRTSRSLEARGKLRPKGPPRKPPLRVDAGKSCIVDLRQSYAISGTLSGSLDVDYRILVHGPCGSRAGRFEEEWIAHGTFAGTLNKVSSRGHFSYTARIKAGGEVEGRMVLGQGLDGELNISGNLRDGRLSYLGRLN